MSDLLSPGDGRAGELFSDRSFLAAMVAVEDAWLEALVDTAVAPSAAKADLSAVISPSDIGTLAEGAERDGNSVTGLVAMLRERTGDQTARWLHRGLTSQDVVDTALMLCARATLAAVSDEMCLQMAQLVRLTETHRRAPMLARTLTQAALPSTVGMKTAHWLTGVLDAADTVGSLPPLPVQAGGAVGTLAAATELTGSADAALALSNATAEALGLAPAMPWHTTRSIVTRIGDALVTCCDAWGHIAADVATGSRTEIGEFTEGQAGGSSTMPHKRNPVMSVLIRSAALNAPPLAAGLHVASASSVDERADGAWHAEWGTLRTLSRRTAAAAGQTTALLTGLQVDTDRAATNLAAAEDLSAEQRSMSDVTGRPVAPQYTGAADLLIESVLARARRRLEEPS
ncbi:3-carboxy-cis,cis-muconate cycloisomerase [Mycobacterium manitobense]|uniref:3-carboxy-cis,cis-muconate cycloisomerase n=1 Tax=[Mycobacterium] manitobense TaxID=190147 RepID=A0A9X3BTS6_9MYCO|nr:lyase family protein [[Mycobacterium] manitobense]MCV7168691.1 3-carboxy-cis,cis-muconate cycloisomerase [[Mycobacterium] manitobense]